MKGSVANQSARDGAGAAADRVASDSVATFRRDDDPNSSGWRGNAIPNQVVSNTLIPTPDELAKVARVNDPVGAGEH